MMPDSITPDDIRKMIETYVQEYSKTHQVPDYWRKPLAAFAKADDRFEVLPEIAAPDHAFPEELLPGGRSVIVFFVPFNKALAKENHDGDRPCRNWGLAYQTTNTLINRLCERLQQFLEDRGYACALVPATHNFDHEKLMARWSHKHLGYLAGLGRFGVNAQLITPAGCTGRLGSLVTDADLGDSPVVQDKELCLHKNGQACLMCVKRCPVGAVSPETGIDRKKCWERLKENLAVLDTFKDMDPSTHVCAKCQVLLPCSLKAPSVSGAKVGRSDVRGIPAGTGL
jgi:epoxyqueuosine reductase QueG